MRMGRTSTEGARPIRHGSLDRSTHLGNMLVSEAQHLTTGLLEGTAPSRPRCASTNLIETNGHLGRMRRDSNKCKYYRTTSMKDELDKEQDKSVRIVAILVLTYFCMGFCLGAQQGWTLIDSFYTCVVTFTTVGYGDFDFGNTDNKDEQLVGVFFILLGVFTFGASLSLFFGRVLTEEQNTVREKALDRERGILFPEAKMSFWQRLRWKLRNRVAPHDAHCKGMADLMEEEAQGRLKVSLIIALLR